MPVNFFFQVCFDHYPWHGIVWGRCCYEKHSSISVLTSLSISPTCFPLADISKWIGIKISLTFSKLIVCVDVRDGNTFDENFIDVLFDGRAGIYINPSSASVEVV